MCDTCEHHRRLFGNEDRGPKPVHEFVAWTGFLLMFAIVAAVIAHLFGFW